MIASEIPSVIESFIKEENPYHCILIDGAWGIGKSFQIDKALKEIPCSISISLFGITTVDEIMTQLAVRICSGAKKGTTIANQIPKLSTILGEIDIGPISSIAKILSTAVSPQIVLDTLLRKSKKDQSSFQAKKKMKWHWHFCINMAVKICAPYKRQRIFSLM